MAATRYQLLYRYINEATNSPITNSSEQEYKPTREFYAYPDHAIFSGNVSTRTNAEDEQQEMIAKATDLTNIKTNMLFAFDGTKKFRHQKWVEDQEGYEVRDWKDLPRNQIGNRGDYTKDFTTLNADTPEAGGTVVCFKNKINKYFKTSTLDCGITPEQGDLSNTYGRYFSEAYLRTLIIESTPFELSTTGVTEHLISKKMSYYWDGEFNKWGDHVTKQYYDSKNNFSYDNGTTKPELISDKKEIAYGYPTNATTIASGAHILQSQLKLITIPGHYEETMAYPYLVIDTYKAIPMSPWFVHATYGSLEAAIQKAKILVDMVGIENIKLIKLVSIDQFIKIS